MIEVVQAQLESFAEQIIAGILVDGVSTINEAGEIEWCER